MNRLRPSQWPVTNGHRPLDPRMLPSLTAGGPNVQELQIARRFADQNAKRLIAQLQAPFPQAGTINLERHWGGRGQGRNYSAQFGPGAHANMIVSNWSNQYSTLTVPPNTRFIAFRGPNFTGDRTEFGPGTHNLHAFCHNIQPGRAANLEEFLGIRQPGAAAAPAVQPAACWADENGPKSGLVVPDVDVQARVQDAMAQIKALASPDNGCYINVTNYETSPVVRAFVSFLDRVIAIFQGSPLVTEYQLAKQQILADLARVVIANQGVCTGAAAAPAPAAPRPAAPGRCPPGTTYYHKTDAQAAIRRGELIELVKEVGPNRGCWRPIQCVRRWSGRSGDMSNTGPFCITDPAVAQCEARGGFLQAQLSVRPGPAGPPVVCIPRGAPLDVQTFVPGRGWMPGAPGLQVESRPPGAAPGGQFGFGFGQQAQQPGFAFPAQGQQPAAGFGGGGMGFGALPAGGGAAFQPLNVGGTICYGLPALSMSFGR